MFAENLDAFFVDFGVACSSNGHDFTGILDTPAELIGLGHGDVVSIDYTLLVKTSEANAAVLKHGSSVTVAGQVYTVRERLPEDDGALTRFTLKK